MAAIIVAMNGHEGTGVPIGVETGREARAKPRIYSSFTSGGWMGDYRHDVILSEDMLRAHIFIPLSSNPRVLSGNVGL